MARPANISKEDIVETARAMFFDRGIAATEMKDIAKECAIGRSSLYRYFDSKESLALVIASDVLRTLSDHVREGLLVSGNAYQKISSALTNLMNFMKTNVEKVRFINGFDQYFTNTYPDNDSSVKYMLQMKDSADALTSVLNEGMLDGSVRHLDDPAFYSGFLMNMLIAAGQRVFPRAKILREEQGYAEEYLDALIDLLLSSISAQ